MEAQQVIEKILADANAEAEKIKKQAQDKQNDEQSKIDEQLKEYKKQTELLAQKAADDEKSHVLAAARMKIAKELLADKRKILDEIFQQAQQQLQTLPDQDYQNLITKLMLDTVETGDEEVIVDKNENRINQDFINHINKELSSNGKGNLKLSDKRQNIAAGFILNRGKIKTNVSINVLLNQTRKDLEIELAKQLFDN
jgi:V/A-type H+-transporting ATPase subunit E